MRKGKTGITTVFGGCFNMRMITVSYDQTKTYSTPLVACIGYFDGMHLGHQALIAKTVEEAKKIGAETALITFDPDPWVLVRDNADVHHITTMRQRLNKSVEFGIQNMVMLKFTKEMSQLSPEDFIALITRSLNLKGIVCGFDFHYGYKGQGDAESLKKDAPCPVYVVEAVEDEEGKISSTRIDQAIEAGDAETASRLLGYEYCLEGTVVHGRGQGRKLGFATANVKYDPEYLLPKAGVYACYVEVNQKRYMGMMNLGHNPTFNYRNDLSLEIHLLDYEGDLYGKHISVYPKVYLREEMKFQNRVNLIMQLERDVRNVRKVLSQ